MSRYALNPPLLGPWTPAADFAVKAWIDYTDPATMTVVGGKVTSGTSKAGIGMSAISASASYNPVYASAVINGKSVARFGGAAMQYLSNSGGGPVNSTDLWRNVGGAWVVAAYASNPSNPNANSRWIVVANTAAATAARFGLLQSYATANAPSIAGRRLDADAFAVLNTTTGNGTSWIIVCGYADYTNSDAFIWVNGTLAASTTTFQTSGVTSDTASNKSIHIGNFPEQTQYATADIAHLVFGNGALSTDLRQRIEGYMAHELGLTGNLPAGHPYKSARPPR